MRLERGQDRRAVRTHLGVLICIAALTIVLYCWPEWVLRLPLACVMRSWLGVRCPFCGMTRDFVAILHGRSPALNVFSWPTAVVKLATGQFNRVAKEICDRVQQSIVLNQVFDENP